MWLQNLSKTETETLIPEAETTSTETLGDRYQDLCTKNCVGKPQAR